MGRGLGGVQRRILEAMRPGRWEELLGLAYLTAGLIDELGEDWPWRVSPSPAAYKATARAVQTLERRGLVESKRKRASHLDRERYKSVRLCVDCSAVLPTSQHLAAREKGGGRVDDTDEALSRRCVLGAGGRACD